MTIRNTTFVPKYEANTAIGQVMQWATEPPRHSFTLFGSRMGVGRVARTAERLVFFGGIVANVILVLGGSIEWGTFAFDIAAMKIAAVVVAQVTQVGTNMVRYVLDPAARDWMRATSPVEFSAIGTTHTTYDAGGESLATAGMGTTQEYLKPGHVPTSNTINIPSEDHGVQR
jgi:hypothetical protein